MNKRLAIWLLVGGGLLVLMATKAKAATPAASSKTAGGQTKSGGGGGLLSWLGIEEDTGQSSQGGGLLDWLGLGDTQKAVAEPDTASGLKVGQIGGDTVYPDQANAINALSQAVNDILAAGGEVEYVSPDFTLSATTPVTVTPVNVYIPITASAVLDQKGEYVLLDAVFLYTESGRDRRYGSSSYNHFGWLDTYFSPSTGKFSQVYRENNVAMPAFGFDLSGHWGIPECFTVTGDEYNKRLRYDSSKDPDGAQLNIWSKTGLVTTS